MIQYPSPEAIAPKIRENVPKIIYLNIICKEQKQWTSPNDHTRENKLWCLRLTHNGVLGSCKRKEKDLCEPVWADFQNMLLSGKNKVQENVYRSL